MQHWRQQHLHRQLDILHVAPELPITRILRMMSRYYVTADLQRDDCDVRLDLCHLPLADASFDVIVASHVLEHIVDDRDALAEIYRVLRPGGTAILVVPITTEETIDWGYNDPQRNDHVRECGLDYFDRYRDAGFDVTLFSTDDFSDAERYALASWRAGRRTPHWISLCQKPRDEGAN